MSLKSAALFEKMQPHFEKHGEGMVAKVGQVYAFEIKADKNAKPVSWTIDLKNGKGQIKQGPIDGVKPDCTFVMLDDDFVLLSQGKLQPQKAFMEVSNQPF